jgi:protein-tyrosine phosphatase
MVSIAEVRRGNVHNVIRKNLKFNFLFFFFFVIFSRQNLGKVLVHCMVGMSRSATSVLAYLMISRKMSAAEAIRTVRMHRDIHPNEGFLQQLADLDNELKRERLYY